jgi:dTDP-4-dehydrorhamnose reductase
MTRWLITGAGGMLGRDLTDLLAGAGEVVTGLARAELDVTDGNAVRDAVEAAKPDVVVNCAAWTAVDDAEAHEAEALAVNGLGAGQVAVACARFGAAMVQVSTDYVFDGLASAPYPESAVPVPGTAYGRGKLAGEYAVLDTLPAAGFVVRTAWLYGAHGPNFVHTMLRLARSGVSPAVVDDQHGQPTWSRDVAARIQALVAAGAAPGIYHATSSGQTTWFGFASEVFRLLDASRKAEKSQQSGKERVVVTPTTSAAYRRAAPRPAYTVLGHDGWAAAGIPPIGDWRDRLGHAFPSLLAHLPN